MGTWCSHPDLVPDEVIVAIPEKEEEHDGGSPLYLRPWEIIHDEVPALRYLVRLRLVEFQDWHTPPPSSDNDYGGRCDSDSDGGDSNYNGYWPGFSESGGGGRRPRTTWYGNPSDPRLGPGSGPGCQPRQRAATIRVGDFRCPVLSTCSAIPCLPSTSRITAWEATRTSALEVDFVSLGDRSHSPVTQLEADPMCAEASLCATPKAACAEPVASMFSIDRDPLRSRASGGLHRGGARELFDEEHTLLGRFSRSLVFEDGPEFLFQPSTVGAPDPVSLAFELDCFSGPDCGSGPSSPGAPGVTVECRHRRRPGRTTRRGRGGLRRRYPPAFACRGLHRQVQEALAQPILSTPRLRQTKPIQHLEEEDDLIPKRSACLAVKSRFRADKPEAQARKVMMKKLGLEVETEVPDEASFDEFHTAFRQPLSPSTRDAMNVLFPGRKQHALRAVSAA